MKFRIFVLATLMHIQSAIAHEEVILSPQRFLEEGLGTATPKAQVVWLTQEIAQKVSHILGHAPTQLRQRYWRHNGKTAWVLEEIGKEEPITAGFVVADGRIQQARVLVYRESRGGEIRHPAFLKQYENAALAPDGRLDRNIDGISGATLSVLAMERMARLALYLNSVAQEQTP
jgi:hypothetical protein